MSRPSSAELARRTAQRTRAADTRRVQHAIDDTAALPPLEYALDAIARTAAAALLRLFPDACCIIGVGRGYHDTWSTLVVGQGGVLRRFRAVPRDQFRSFFRLLPPPASTECVEARELTVQLPLDLPFTMPIRHVLAARGRLDGQIVASVFVLNALTREATQLERHTVEVIAGLLPLPLQTSEPARRMTTERDRLREQLIDAQIEHAALMAISAKLVEPHPLRTLLTAALHVAVEALQFDAGNVRLYDAATEQVVLAAHVGFNGDYESLVGRIPLARSPLRDVLLRGVVQTVTRDWYRRLDAAVYPVHLFPKLESALSVPITLGEKRIGVLNLFRLNPSDFLPRELDLAQSLANQLAVLVEHRRLLEQRELRLLELDLLNRINLRASTAHTIREVMQAVVVELQPALNAAAALLIITDGSLDFVNGAVQRAAELQPQDITGQRADLPHDLADLVDPQYLAAHAGASGSGTWVTARLTDRAERPFGLLALRDLRTDAADWLRSVAAPQIALQLENVQLLEQRARQIRELQVIGSIGAVATASGDLQVILEQTQQLVLSITAADVFYLLICDPVTHHVSHSIFVEDGHAYSAGLDGRIVPAGTFTDLIITGRAPLLLRDIAVERHDLAQRGYHLQSVGPNRSVQSWLGVPLLARDGAVIGVLSLQQYRPYAYDQTHLEFLTQVAYHLSLGVQKVLLFADRERQSAENARLFAAAQAQAVATERHAMRMELMNRISSLLAGSLDQHEILAITARELVERFWTDQVVMVLGGAGMPLQLALEHPRFGLADAALPADLDAVLTGLASARRPTQIVDCASDDRARPFTAWASFDIRSIALIPMVSRDTVFGMLICLAHGTPRGYSGEELELLMSVATAVATAYQNARLFAAEQEQRRTAETLREMARVLSSSVDLEQVLALVLAELSRVVPYRSAAVALLDGALLKIVSERPFNWHADASLAPAAAIAAAEVVQRRTAGATLLSAPNGDTAHWIGVPLSAHQHLLGVLSVVLAGPSVAIDRDREVLSAFGDHAALAIENASLYQQSVARVEQEMLIARQIQSQLFPSRLPSHPQLQVAARCLPAHETGGDFYDVIDLPQGLAVLIGDVSGKSLPAAMIMAVARSIARSEARSHVVPSRVMSETNDWLVGDLPRNVFVALGYALFDPLTLRVKLASAGQIPPLLRRADGSVMFLERDGALPLGIRRDAHYAELEVQLAAGELVVFSTDGIVSAQNADRELYGFERLACCVEACPVSEPHAVMEYVLADVAAFRGTRPNDDDLTIIVVSIGAVRT